MSGPNGNVSTLLGDIPEYGGGGWVRLPDSYYIGAINVVDVEATDPQTNDQDEPNLIEDENVQGGFFLDCNDNQVQKGNTVYATLEFEAIEGPFEGNGFTSRFYLTPGKGPNIGFVQNAANVLGGGVNLKVLKDWGFEFPVVGKNVTGEALKEARREAQQLFRKYFLSLTADDRITFMTKYCNIAKWDGTEAVVKVELEAGDERTDDFGQVSTPQFNRYKGFYALNHGKKGAGWVRNVCHRKQAVHAMEMGLVNPNDEQESPVSATSSV